MKKPFIYLLTASLAFSLIANTSTTYAEERPTQSYDSEATVTFEAPEGAVEPLDPDNPNTALDPDNHDGETTNSGGPLSLDYVSNLVFGEENNPLEITSETVTYESMSQKPFIQVSDYRGTGAGWRVTASASPFNSTEEDNTLIGATILLVDGNTESPTEGSSPNLDEQLITLPDNTEVNGIQLVSGAEAATTVVTAPAKMAEQQLSESPGQGTWLMRWFNPEETGSLTNSNVLLTVLGNTASPGTHTSIITWTLENGPTGPVPVEPDPANGEA